MLIILIFLVTFKQLNLQRLLPFLRVLFFSLFEFRIYK